MTTYAPQAQTLEQPWPFTGREDELELLRASLTGGRKGIVVTGPAGRGKTRLLTEAVRGTDCVRVTGTPESRSLPFAAFAHLLPEQPSLHRALRHLAGVRLLVVDDAHLLDDASAALVHQLALHANVRLAVAVADDTPVPAAVSRLWTGELLPRLALPPLPRAETCRLLAECARLEPLTAGRLHRLAQGDLRLLRDLLGTLRAQGLDRVPDTGERAWRGPLPTTPAVRERLGRLLDRPEPADRDVLERLAFAEPLPPHLDELDLDVLERLENDGLIHVDDHGLVRLADPLHGPALRAGAGRLRTRRLARAPHQCALALAAEQRTLTDRMAAMDVRDLPAPVGQWLVDEGAPVPAGYAAARARFARLRGELREAAAWAREGLRHTPDAPLCRTELALALAQSGDVAAVTADNAAVWAAAARGDLTAAVHAAARGRDAYALHDAVRLGAPERVAGRLVPRQAAAPESARMLGRHAEALLRGDGPALDRAAEALEERGFLLFAAEAHAQAAGAHRDPTAARTSRTRAVALVRRCQGARTPALAGLVLGELTTRQRQIVTLAAAGLSNRQIAERLTLSVRTVGNHLYSAYARLGAGDRTELPWLTDRPAAASA